MLSFLAGKKVCVTGASGFLGRHLLSALGGTGADVTCVVRKSSGTAHIPAGCRIAVADLSTGEGLDQALAGQQTVLHLAGALFGLSWQEYLGGNAGAAGRMARALGMSGSLERLVFVSSLAAAGPCAAEPGLDEGAVAEPVSAYGWSKLLSERIFSAALGKKAVILRPPIIYGSGDRGLLPLFRSVRLGLAVAPGHAFPLSAIHASDAALAALLCCGPQASGTYHVSDGHRYDMGRICSAMAHAMGAREPLLLRPPAPLMAAGAAAGTLGGRLARGVRSMLGKGPGRAPNWNLDKYRESRAAGWLANPARIRSELGFAARMPLDAGMAEAVAGYRREGWL